MPRDYKVTGLSDTTGTEPFRLLFQSVMRVIRSRINAFAIATRKGDVTAA